MSPDGRPDLQYRAARPGEPSGQVEEVHDGTGRLAVSHQPSAQVGEGAHTAGRVDPAQLLGDLRGGVDVAEREVGLGPRQARQVPVPRASVRESYGSS